MVVCALNQNAGAHPFRKPHQLSYDLAHFQVGFFQVVPRMVGPGRIHVGTCFRAHIGGSELPCHFQMFFETRDVGFPVFGVAVHRIEISSEQGDFDVVFPEGFHHF